ncbi:MAG: TatD family hydrolase [Candidatus Bathyarchaeota archaeon]|nr:TatD family hydrolase [Candidatus Bathyarchaeota archaeon]
MRLIDTHAHIGDIQDIDASLERAKQVGVSAIMGMGTSLSSCIRTLEIAEKYPGYIYPCVGVHPTEFFKEDIEAALKYVKEHAPQCTAIGEIGLDYWLKPLRKDKALKEAQINVYTRQLEFAAELELPTSIHSRGAWRDCLTLAIKHGSGRAVFHWYSGPLDVLRDALDNGFYVSCTPAIESSPELRAAMSNTPIERILVETDSPVWIRGIERTSEPSDVALTVKHLAALKEMPIEDVAEMTWLNAKKLFNLDRMK